MRRLIVCCDGTWNRADWEGGTATNVVRIARAVRPQARPAVAGVPEVPQIVYYHPGVGTGNRVDRLLGGGLGLGLSQNVRDAYAFLVNNHAPGDEIFLFGFSRGAYTARALGGLIGTIGLLRKDQMGGFLDAWAYHRLDPAERKLYLEAFNRAFPGRREAVAIRAVAVWDTVGALGIPANRFAGHFQPCKGSYRFHDTTLGDHVEHAFQALALDEKRGPFQPTVWQRSPSAPVTQVLRQMWFAGVHSDIGGGYRDHGNSDVSLLWIAGELIERGLLDLDEAVLLDQLDRSQPYGRAVLHESRTWTYRVLGRPAPRHVGEAERVHATVEQRVARGGYRDTGFLARHAGQVAPLSAFEARVAGYAPQSMTVRPPLLRERATLCDRIVRYLAGG